MTPTLKEVGGGGGGGVRQKWDVIGCRGWGVNECSGRPIFIFLLKKIGFPPMTRHHAEPNINVLLTRNLPFDSDFRQWRHPLMISLDAYNRTHGQFKCDVTWFRFCFEFVHTHGTVVVPEFVFPISLLP